LKAQGMGQSNKGLTDDGQALIEDLSELLISLVVLVHRRSRPPYHARPSFSRTRRHRSSSYFRRPSVLSRPTPIHRGLYWKAAFVEIVRPDHSTGRPHISRSRP
jgi:hypothetical protein